MTDDTVTDLFGGELPEVKFEVHSHSFISGPRSSRGQGIVHSHAGGELPHKHPETGPASYTIDKRDWLRMTGLEGGGEKEFTPKPDGEQLPIVELEEWQKSFEIHHGEPPVGFEGSGGGFYTAARMVLGSRMTVAKIIPFPGPKKATG